MATRLADILRLDEFEEAGRRHLPRSLFAYVSGGVEDDRTLRENRAVFDELSLLPRVLVNVAGRSPAKAFLGRSYAAPFGIAPMGLAALSAYRGDLVLAGAAEQAKIPMILSSSSLTRLEAVIDAAPGSWFQAYMPAEPARIAALVDRVDRAGYSTLVVTVDTSVMPNRENNVRAGFRTPMRLDLRTIVDGLTHPRWSVFTFLRTIALRGMPHFENNEAVRGAPVMSRHVARDFSGREHLDWDALRRIRQQWPRTVVVKGILNVADATLARDAGADAIIVSNHGGRQLDGTPSPMRMLPRIRAALPDMPIAVDSGFRRGTDILKALALGADFVFVGRPFNYAAAIAGRAGVEHAISLLKAEVRIGMGMLGLTTLDELGADSLLVSPNFELASVPRR